MIKAIVKLPNGDRLNDIYKKMQEDLIEISGYDSVIDRKDNDDIWIEQEIWEDREYTITTEFTEEEIEYLKKNYSIEILEG